MQIFVKSLEGNTLALNVTPASSVASVKAMIAEREGTLKSFLLALHCPLLMLVVW